MKRHIGIRRPLQLDRDPAVVLDHKRRRRVRGRGHGHQPEGVFQEVAYPVTHRLVLRVRQPSVDDRSAIRFPHGMPRLVSLVLWGCLIVMGTAAIADSAGERRLYVAPEKEGTGSGETPANAAAFQDAAFWQTVQAHLEEEPVTVAFLDGTYLCLPHLELNGLGHEIHRLTLRGDTTDGAVFRRHPDDPEENADLFTLNNCRNLALRHLHFRGDERIGYAFRARAGSRDIDIEHCTWIDLHGVRYGAAGTTGSTTRDITFRNCVFKRIGFGGHSHMIYNAYGPRRVRVIDSEFEDCPGDYVRFRDRSDFGVIKGSTFTATSNYHNATPPFISVPQFNSRGPGHPRGERYETFGTHFLVFNNVFRYPANRDTTGRRYVLLLDHRGFNPPGLSHLMTPEEGAILESGGKQERLDLLQRNTRLDLRRIRVFNNRIENETHRLVFGSFPAYGAEDTGWRGFVPLDDLLNDSLPDAKEMQKLRRLFGLPD